MVSVGNGRYTKAETPSALPARTRLNAWVFGSASAIIPQRYPNPGALTARCSFTCPIIAANLRIVRHGWLRVGVFAYIVERLVELAG